MDALERQQTIEVALLILRNALVETKTSIALYDNRIYFFGTDDYLTTGDISKCPRFSVSIDKLVN